MKELKITPKNIAFLVFIVNSLLVCVSVLFFVEISRAYQEIGAEPESLNYWFFTAICLSAAGSFTYWLYLSKK